MSERRLLAVLQTLAENECQFIVVGGLAAVLNGAPIHTYDIDLVYARTAENIGRLLFVLALLDAVFRMQPERRLRPAASHLSGQEHLSLLTSAGPLDLLATVGRDLTYEDLAPHSLEMNVGEGVRIKVLDLETLIALKEALGGEKDLAMLPVLRQTLKETRKKSDS